MMSNFYVLDHVMQRGSPDGYLPHFLTFVMHEDSIVAEVRGSSPAQSRQRAKVVCRALNIIETPQQTVDRLPEGERTCA